MVIWSPAHKKEIPEKGRRSIASARFLVYIRQHGPPVTTFGLFSLCGVLAAGLLLVQMRRQESIGLLRVVKLSRREGTRTGGPDSLVILFYQPR